MVEVTTEVLTESYTRKHLLERPSLALLYGRDAQPLLKGLCYSQRLHTRTFLPFKYQCFQVYLLHGTCVENFLRSFPLWSDNDHKPEFPQAHLDKMRPLLPNGEEIPGCAFRIEHGWPKSNGYVVKRLKPSRPCPLEYLG